MAVLIMLGMHPPGELTDLIARAVSQVTQATQLGGAR
jgi:hypothetical protein